MLQHLIEAYGYPAILLGTFLEGETVLILAGFAAHRGYLSPWGVIAAAFLGSLAGDQLYFFIGRRYHPWLLARRPQWTQRVESLRDRLERHDVALMIGFRFVYGIRTVTPFAIGMSRVPASRFLLFNALGAALWAAAIGGAGYFLGEVFRRILGDVTHYEEGILLVIVALGVGLWGWRSLRERARRDP